mmetsp:Transcript_17867/g.45791  ORF Transcript_17867/g.45791 Transcript_17867/m.45791 type:complete len:237 (-) Transcript_17867:360-1070(-)
MVGRVQSVMPLGCGCPARVCVAANCRQVNDCFPSTRLRWCDGPQRWKLARGKFRPGLQNKADANSEANCKAATGAAFEAAEQAEGLLGCDLGIGGTGGVGRELQKATIAAVEAMSKGPPKLQGIGPATASALLAAGNDCFPFMSDEAAEAALPSSTKLKYNVNEYWLFCAAARAKAAELSGDALADAAWSAVAVERALWAAAMGDKYGDLPSTAGVDSATEEQADGAPRSKRRKRA